MNSGGTGLARFLGFPPDFDTRVSHLRDALGFLTRLPVGFSGNPNASSGWAWPLAGAAVGAAAGTGGYLALALGGAPQLAALIALGLLVALTGGIHEDGLADSFDGMACGKDSESRLAAMRDSRIGTYGAIALILFLLGRWQGLSALGEGGSLLAALTAACAASRATMLAVMRLIPPARAEGLSAHFGTPSFATTSSATAIAIAIAIAALGWSGVLMLAVAALAAVPIALYARVKLGGQTGDILGACQQSAEAAAILCVALIS